MSNQIEIEFEDYDGDRRTVLAEDCTLQKMVNGKIQTAPLIVQDLNDLRRLCEFMGWGIDDDAVNTATIRIYFDKPIG